MTLLETETIDGLNVLLEDQRASVEILLALANGATERAEREVFQAMGGEAVLGCCTLRECLDGAEGASVSWRVNGIVFPIVGQETYDERLRAYATFLKDICDRVEGFVPDIPDVAVRQILRDIYTANLLAARWCSQRAEVFAESRTMEFSKTRSLITGVTPITEEMELERAALTQEPETAPFVRPHRPDRAAEEAEYLGEQGETPDTF